MIASKIILLKHLKKMLGAMVLFKVKVNQGFKMILEGHLKRPVALRFELRHVGHCALDGFKKLVKFDCLTVFLRLER